MMLSTRQAFVCCALAVGVFSGGGLIAACSSSNPDNGGGNNNDASTGDGGGTQSGACPNPTVPIIFAAMYSAFIPGSTAQTFAIPAVTGDGNTATWSLSDPTQGNLQPQSFTNGGVTTPGVMITIAGTGNSQGQVTVFATESGGACGAAVLNITTNSENDWTIGNARYNDGVALHLGGGGHGDGGRPEGGFGEGGRPDGGFQPGDGGGSQPGDGGSFFEQDGGTACTNCHGPTATNGPFNDVSHTPEQTGGFSDSDLQSIILNGEVPDGGYFDPTVLNSNCDGGAACTAQAYNLWHNFHRWSDITTDELPGIICYLRGLTPEGQTGTSNFGGHHHDGGKGGGPPMDAASGD